MRDALFPFQVTRGMKDKLTLRFRLLLLALLLAAHEPAQAQQPLQFSWDNVPDRSWPGPNFWANRLQDWHVSQGRLECLAAESRLGLRTVHLLTHRLADTAGSSFRTTVRLGIANPAGKRISRSSVAGFLVGVGGATMDYRAAALVHQFRGPGAGILAAVRTDGSVFFQDYEKPGFLGIRERPSGTLSRDGWKVVRADSTEAGNPAANVLDGNPATVWHTEWKLKKPPHPHEIVIDMGAVRDLAGFAYLPRPENAAGRIDRYEFYLSNDPRDWGQPIASGRLPNEGKLQRIRFERTTGRYFKLVALSAHLERPSTTVAELYALSDKTEQPAPVGNDTGRLAGISLQLEATPLEDGNYQLQLESVGADGNPLGTASMIVPASRLVGNVALASHPGQVVGERVGGRYWFQDWQLTGDRLDVDPERMLGPIVATQYTLSRGTLKLTAQLVPLGEKDTASVQLQLQQEGAWEQVAEATIIRPGFTAPLRVDDWSADKDVPYRVVYQLMSSDGMTQPYSWEGIIRKDPVDKPTIVVAGFTGNHNNSHLISRQPFDWTTGIWFPHDDVVGHVAQHKPDILFFSGDQVYEGRSPTFADRDHIKQDYLYKWFLWCWAYRGLTRSTPCVTIPDDHDVYQGNLWGEGGRPIHQDHFGGYVHPADFVQMVERTQTSHLPDPYDPEPAMQGIKPYYTSLVYGRIGFAVLEDRKFKSGCAGRLPPTGTARPDHINNPEFDVRRADIEGVQLLGPRQLEFLADWGKNWQGTDMKMALSQTIFAGMATHHGPNLDYLIADLDSNGWPQSGRNRALDALRRCFAFHLAGDQHLATIVQHGLDQHGDGPWSFCVPSIANFYPRKWSPLVEGANRPAGAPSWQGEHRDGLGNLVTVYAATNPGEDLGHEPRALHNGMPGYGIVRLNKQQRTITMECWPRFADPENPDHRPYPGWPRTISQQDNYARQAVAYLPRITTNVDDPVIQVINQATGETEYTLRIRGREFRPRVFAKGKYTLVVSRPDQQQFVELRDVASIERDDKATLNITVFK